MFPMRYWMEVCWYIIDLTILASLVLISCKQQSIGIQIFRDQKRSQKRASSFTIRSCPTDNVEYRKN